MTKKHALLSIEDLKVHLHTERGKITAVDGVCFEVGAGEIVGIVGESGCGKSVMSQSILRLLEHTDSVSYEGKILFEGRNILEYGKSELHELRGNQISMIFQEPLTSLNPVYTIGDQIEEILRLHQRMTKKQARRRALELLEWTEIGSPQRCISQYPHELSGGMQQRVMIAMALACEPKLLIADEPTTALDVTTQAQIMKLLIRLNKKLGMAILFITHDLGVVWQICNSVKVMYLGQIVEDAPGRQLLNDPRHPYTKGLIASIPRLERERGGVLPVISGTVPSLFEVPKGCRFHTRCPYAVPQCQQQEPQSEDVPEEQRKVKCWRYKELHSAAREEGV